MWVKINCGGCAGEEKERKIGGQHDLTNNELWGEEAQDRTAWR